MANEKENNLARQKHVLKALSFVEDGGNVERASEMLTKAKEDRIEVAKIPGHPLNTLYAENDALTNLIEEKLLPDLKKWQQDGKDEELFRRLKDDLRQLSSIKYHYKRKENILFSFLIKYKLIDEDTSSALWGLNDRIRDRVKVAIAAVNEDPLPDKYIIENKIEEAARQVKWMIFVENTILLPILSLLLTPEDWYMVKQDELEIGYSLIGYPKGWSPSKVDIDQASWDRDQAGELSKDIRVRYSEFLSELLSIAPIHHHTKVLEGDPSYPVGDEKNSPDLIFPDVKDTAIRLEVGSLSLKELQGIANVLPIDLTFVDKYDKVKWFSNTDRIFPRTRSVIGRPVIRCHPPKSINYVLKILDDFHKGLADSSDFWVTVHGRLIYLCFYAVRDNEDNYLGCLETVQDITRFKTLSGEKTLENQDKYED